MLQEKEFFDEKKAGELAPILAEVGAVRVMFERRAFFVMLSAGDLKGHYHRKYCQWFMCERMTRDE